MTKASVAPTPPIFPNPLKSACKVKGYGIFQGVLWDNAYDKLAIDSLPKILLLKFNVPAYPNHIVKAVIKDIKIDRP